MKMRFSAAIAAMSITSALAGSPSALAGPGDAAAPIVTAQARPGTPSRSDSRMSTAQGDDRYGTPAGDMPYDREIRLGPATRGVSVNRNETVRFVTAEGREFRWRFDTFRSFEVFPLSQIAPADVAVAASVSVYVNGEIPIAP